MAIQNVPHQSQPCCGHDINDHHSGGCSLCACTVPIIAPRCRVHGKTPVLVYPCCVGAQGGARKSKRKAKASARNGRKGGRPPRPQGAD